MKTSGFYSGVFCFLETHYLKIISKFNNVIAPTLLTTNSTETACKSSKHQKVCKPKKRRGNSDYIS
jgi:hypothetical protein